MEIEMEKKLLKLAGMKYKSGCYTPERWIEITGVDPRNCSPYVKVLSNDLCVWTPLAEKFYENHCKMKRFHFDMLCERG